MDSKNISIINKTEIPEVAFNGESGHSILFKQVFTLKQSQRNKIANSIEGNCDSITITFVVSRLLNKPTLECRMLAYGGDYDKLGTPIKTTTCRKEYVESDISMLQKYLKLKERILE